MVRGLGNYLKLVSLATIVVHTNADLECTYPQPSIPTQWIVMSDECQKAMTGLVNQKLQNAAQYLALGAFFKRDSINRLGFAAMFYNNADANRNDAIKLIDYIVMRGKYTKPDHLIDLFYTPSVVMWDTAEDGLTTALNMEADLTNQFHDTITTCEKSGINDYNIANWLSRYFLLEQYDDQKYFADLISSLDKMKTLHLNLAEFLMDHELDDVFEDDDDDDDDETDDDDTDDDDDDEDDE